MASGTNSDTARHLEALAEMLERWLLTTGHRVEGIPQVVVEGVRVQAQRLREEQRG